MTSTALNGFLLLYCSVTAVLLNTDEHIQNFLLFYLEYTVRFDIHKLRVAELDLEAIVGNTVGGFRIDI